MSIHAIAEALQIGDRDLGTCFSLEIEPGIAVCMSACVQNHIVVPWNDPGKGRFLFIQERNYSGHHMGAWNQPHCLGKNVGKNGTVGERLHPGGSIKTSGFPCVGRLAKINVFLHSAKQIGILGRVQTEGIVQPDAPIRLTGGDRRQNLAIRIRDVPIQRQGVAIAGAYHAVDCRPGVHLIPGNIRVVEQHLHGEHVLPLSQVRRQLHGFIILPVQIALAGAGQHGRSVHPQAIAGNSRDAGRQTSVCGKRLFTAKIGEPSAQIAVEDLLARQFFLGNPNPLRLFSHGCILILIIV